MSPDVAVIIGTRPEAIKCAPLVFALRARGAAVRIVASGQHAELLDDALAAFDLKADVNLRAMAGPVGLAALTSRLIERIDAELQDQRPRLVTVQGDTSTTLAGALAAFYQRVPCAHIEAGLRSGRMDAPWPEEMNRSVVSRVSRRHYAPTGQARDNLLREGTPAESIVVAGQTGVDAALWMAARPAPQLPDGAFVYVTAHRRENQAGGIANVVRGVCAALDAASGLRAVLAAHPSPEVRAQLAGIAHPRLRISEPVSYAESVALIARAAVIVTDSGGIQEEAPAFGTPVLVTRDVTERPEGVEAGFARVVGTAADAVSTAIAETLADTGLRDRLRATPNPYGDGRAAERIADDLLEFIAP